MSSSFRFILRFRSDTRDTMMHTDTQKCTYACINTDTNMYLYLYAHSHAHTYTVRTHRYAHIAVPTGLQYPGELG